MSLDENRGLSLSKRNLYIVIVLTNLFAIVLTTSVVVGIYESRRRHDQARRNNNTTMNVFDNLQLLYQQNFELNPRISDFEFSDPAAWKLETTTISANKNNTALHLFGKSQYEARVRSPSNIAFLKLHQFDDFIMEVDVQQTSREYNHRDFCLFFGMKDATNYYYVHMGSQPDATSHNIFIVNDEDRRSIGNNTSVLSPSGVDWGTPFGGEWQKVRLHRQSQSGEIYVYFNDKLILQALDTHFPSGFLGLGSFDDTGIVDNIRVWGSDTVSARYGFFV